MFKKIMVMLLLAGTLMASMDINKATKADFMAISGIGEKKAESIIKYRKKHGKFKSVNDLRNVKGIGDSIVENVKKGKKNAAKDVSKNASKKKQSKKKEHKKKTTKTK
jgi:competence protein ComEA